MKMPDGKEFHWGRVSDVIEIGCPAAAASTKVGVDGTYSPAYTIIAYYPWKNARYPGAGATPFQTVGKRETEDALAYHIYIGTKDTNTGAKTLDKALLVALCYGNLKNPNDANWTAVVLARALGIAP